MDFYLYLLRDAAVLQLKEKLWIILWIFFKNMLQKSDRTLKNHSFQGALFGNIEIILAIILTKFSEFKNFSFDFSRCCNTCIMLTSSIEDFARNFEKSCILSVRFASVSLCRTQRISLFWRTSVPSSAKNSLKRCCWAQFWLSIYFNTNSHLRLRKYLSDGSNFNYG